MITMEMIIMEMITMVRVMMNFTCMRDPDNAKDGEKVSHVEYLVNLKHALVHLIAVLLRSYIKHVTAQVLPHTNFADTFFDLFYVAAAYNLGILIKNSPTNLGVLYFVGCFYPIMMIWNQKMFYDARFDSGRDLYHRFSEFLVLVVLATAVLYIRPVTIMSTTSDNEDMFVFSLCITLSSILAIGRSIDIKRNVDGDLAAKRTSEYEFKWYGLMTAFYASAMIVSAVDYFGSSDSNYGSAHRFLGAAAGAIGDTNHVPISLLLAGAVCHPLGIIFQIFRPRFIKDYNPQE
jgi:hypothetical protein